MNLLFVSKLCPFLYLDVFQDSGYRSIAESLAVYRPELVDLDVDTFKPPAVTF